MSAAALFRRRTTLWVSLLLFVMATLAPGVSRALAHVQGDLAPWAQICTTASSTPDGADAASHLMDHCPLCALQGHTPTLPLPAASDWVPLALAQAMPALFLQSSRRLFAWTVPAPRGPPLTV